MPPVRTLASVRHHGMELADYEFTVPLLRAFEDSQPFETNPIFAVLHEMCYTQGAAALWSAERVRAEFQDMNWAPGQLPSFTGEMIYPWMFEDYAGLRPLRDVAELLASEERWPALYDPAQLTRNTVPCVAAIYAEDMYVPRALRSSSGCWRSGESRSSGGRLLPSQDSVAKAHQGRGRRKWVARVRRVVG